MSDKIQRDTPYKGLIPYSEVDAKFFFGRESEQVIVAANLLASRFTLLYGPSGVGKTSVLRAGVASGLRRQARQNLAARGKPRFVMVIFKEWKDDPLTGLLREVRRSVEDSFEGQPFDPVPSDLSFTEELRAWSERINGKLLIILDQFEEYFLYPQAQGAGSFAVEFPRSVNLPDLRVNFLVSLRDDWLAKLDFFKGAIPNLFDNYLRIGRLEREAARAAIEGPLKKYNEQQEEEGKPEFKIEGDFTNRVLNQLERLTSNYRADEIGLGAIVGRDSEKVATQEGIQTPYLQLVMIHLWEKAKEVNPPTLSEKMLDDDQAARKIVQSHVDEVMKTLGRDEQEIASKIFLHLITPSGTKIAQKAEDLAQYAGLGELELKKLLDNLTKKESGILSRIAPAPGQPLDERYEIYHDALAVPLLRWRTAYLTRQKDALARVKAEKEARAKIDEQREKAKRFRKYLIAASAGLCLMIVATGLAVTQSIAAKGEKRKADEERSKAEILRADALEKQQVAEDAVGKRDIAYQQLKLKTIETERLKVVADNAVVAAERSERDATAQKNEAITQRSVAVAALSTAEKERGKAERAFVDARDAKERAEKAEKVATYNASIANIEKGKAELLRDKAQVANEKLLVAFEETKNAKDTAEKKSQEAEDAKRIVMQADRLIPYSRAVMRGHVSSVASADLSRNEKFIVTSGEDGRVLVWDASNLSLSYPFDGQWFDSSLYKPPMDLMNRKEDETLQTYDYSPAGAAFSPDEQGKLVISIVQDAQRRTLNVLVQDRETGKSLHTLSGHKENVTSVALSPDGNLALTGSMDGTSLLWDLRTCQNIEDKCRSIILDSLPSPENVKSVTFSHDGTLALTGSTDNKARVWSVNTCLNGACVPEELLRDHNGDVNDVAFSFDDKFIVTASSDGSAVVWGTKKGRKLATMFERWEFSIRRRKGFFPFDLHWITRRRVPYLSASLSPDLSASRNVDESASFVATAGKDGLVKIWDRKSGISVRVFRGHIGPVNRVIFSSGGKYILTAGSDGTTRVWEPCRKSPAELLASVDLGSREARRRFENYCKDVK